MFDSKNTHSFPTIKIHGTKKGIAYSYTIRDRKKIIRNFYMAYGW